MFPSLVFLTRNECRRCGQKLVHGVNLGMARHALNDASLNQGTLDFEGTTAARRTL